MSGVESIHGMDCDTSSTSSSHTSRGSTQHAATNENISRTEVEMKKREERLIQLLTELIQTERKYVQDLDQTCRLYFPMAGWDYRRESKSSERHPKLSNRRMSGAHSLNLELGESIKQPSKQEIRQMLGNIESIRDYHSRVMLPKLEGAVVAGDSQSIRSLFKGEQRQLSMLYGRYCINKTRSSLIVEEYMQFFTLLQNKREILLRVDAELIKPIQRITRYHMFLNSLSKTSKDLGLKEAAKDFSLALEAILEATNHTNRMMWIGRMENCPLELASQGQLLKEGDIFSKLMKERRRSFQGLMSRNTPGVPTYVLLFQQSLIFCRKLSTTEEYCDPRLVYNTHISMNQVRVRDICAEDSLTFEVQRVEGVRPQLTNNMQEGAVARITCSTEQVKNAWVSAINSEVKILRTVARSLSNTYLNVYM